MAGQLVTKASQSAWGPWPRGQIQTQSPGWKKPLGTVSTSGHLLPACSTHRNHRGLPEGTGSPARPTEANSKGTPFASQGGRLGQKSTGGPSGSCAQATLAAWTPLERWCLGLCLGNLLPCSFLALNSSPLPHWGLDSQLSPRPCLPQTLLLLKLTRLKAPSPRFQIVGQEG